MLDDIKHPVEGSTTMSDAQAVADLIVIARELLRRFEAIALELGVTGPQMELLDSLADGPVPSGELADRMHCDASNVTRLLDRLGASTDEELVERTRSEADRRVVLVGLTASGRRVVDEHRRERTRDVPLFAGLDDDGRETLAALLRQVAATLASGPTPAATTPEAPAAP